MINPIEHNTLYSEPWINFELKSITGEKNWTKKDEIVWNQIQRQMEKHKFYVKAFDFISDNVIQGDYHEYGCHRCRTFRMAMLEANRHFLEDMFFYAYDSFAGLPAVTSEIKYDERWQEGTLTTTEEEFEQLILESGFSLNKVRLKKGYYNETLVNEVYQMCNNRKASLIAIDCDLYESAVPIFNSLDCIIQEGTILYLDDYFTGYKGNPTKGVSRAFTDWLYKTDWKAEPYREVGWAGKSFILY